MKPILYIAIAILLFTVASYGTIKYRVFNKMHKILVASFEECKDAGYTIIKTSPPQCKTRSGETYTQNVGNSELKKDLVRLESPQPGDRVESPLVVKGEARGSWFFEASFPVKLYGPDGALLATGIAMAGGEWMTTNFVPFEVTLIFDAPLIGSGKLYIIKDNPSGLPAHDDALIIPVRF